MFANHIMTNSNEFGLAQKLPPMPEQRPVEIEENNILVILIN